MAVLVASTVAAATVAAPAGGAADEEALIRRALVLRRHGDDAQALPLLERAYAIARSPRAAAQLGFAEQALGRWPEADTHVGEALRAEGDPWVARNRAVVAESLSTIRAHQAQAQARPASPAGVQPPPAIAPLASASPPLPAAPPRPLFSRPPPDPVVVASPARADDGGDDRGHGRRAAGVGVAVGGFAALGLGVASSLVSSQKLDAIKADARADRPYNEANGNWKTYDRAAAVLYVAGAGAIVSGILLYRSGAHQEESGAAPTVRSLSLRPQVTAQRIGVTLAAGF